MIFCNIRNKASNFCQTFSKNSNFSTSRKMKKKQTAGTFSRHDLDNM